MDVSEIILDNTLTPDERRLLLEKDVIETTLLLHHGNTVASSRWLGWTLEKFEQKMATHGIEVEEWLKRLGLKN